MIKTLASILAIYTFTNGQAPPMIPAVPSVPQLPPQVPEPQAPVTTQSVIAPPIVTEPLIIATQRIEIPPVAPTQPQPPVTTPQPPVITPQPPVTTPQPPVTTLQPEVITPQPPVVTPQPPVVTPQPPVTTAQTAQPYIPITDAPIAQPITTASPPVPTIPLLPPGQFYGEYGQICDYNKSPLKDVVCKAPGQFGLEQYPGFMKCERGYDCCMCGKITCGNQWQGCNTFSAGDQGVFGVQNIQIYGQDVNLGGASLNFIGFEAGANANVEGTNIKSIRADGELALLNAKVTVNPIADFSLECSGPAACDKLDLEIHIPGPPAGYRCNPNYPYEPMELAALHCGGKQSCLNAHIKLINEGCFDIDLQQLECTLPDSCIGTTFEFIEVNGRITINSCDVGNSMQIPNGIAEKCGLGMGQGQQPWQQTPPPGQWLPAV